MFIKCWKSCHGKAGINLARMRKAVWELLEKMRVDEIMVI